MAWLDSNGVKVLWAGIKAKLSGKVDKVEGKGLSEVDVTASMKEGWDAAEKNTIVGVSVKKGENSSDASIDPETRKVTIEMPTKYSELNNDLTGDDELLNKRFYTDSIKPEIDAVASASLTREIVTELPANADLVANKIYLVPKDPTDETNNEYTEYMVVVTGEGESATKKAEKIGDTKIDLSGYVKKDEMIAMSADEINAIINDETEESGAGTPSV